MEQSFERVGGFVILTPDMEKSLETFKSYGIIGRGESFIRMQKMYSRW